MKTGVYKENGKNFDGGYSGQIDRGETQIQVFAPTVKERNRLLKQIKQIIKPGKTIVIFRSVK